MDCYDRGGVFVGAFDGATLAGVMILENKFIGRAQDTLQLKFLHVGRPYRDQGLGTALFQEAARLARARGAQRLYISATPSEHTINFYLGQGCVVTAEPDPELWELEPEDIHLECRLVAIGAGSQRRPRLPLHLFQRRPRPIYPAVGNK